MHRDEIIKILRLSLTLTVICVVAGSALALTYSATERQIKNQAREEEKKSNQAALPIAKAGFDFKRRDDLASKVRKESKDVVKIYEALQDGKRVGWVVQVAPRGYGGPLLLAVGIDMRGKVKGISVIESKETPGLGQGIEKVGFQKQFIGKDENAALEVGEDIDALTGATISSKATASGVKQALQAIHLIGGK